MGDLDHVWPSFFRVLEALYFGLFTFLKIYYLLLRTFLKLYLICLLFRRREFKEVGTALNI